MDNVNYFVDECAESSFLKYVNEVFWFTYAKVTENKQFVKVWSVVYELLEPITVFSWEAKCESNIVTYIN